MIVIANEIINLIKRGVMKQPILVNGLYRTGTTMLIEFLGVANYYYAPETIKAIGKEHIAVRRHSNKLLKEFGADWIHPNKLKNIDNVNFTHYLSSNKEAKAWCKKARRLGKRMAIEAKQSGQVGWVWKDTRLPVTMPAWRLAIPEAKYIIGYRSPDQFLKAMQIYRDNDWWGFKDMSDEDFIWQYEFYYTHLLKYIESEKGAGLEYIAIDYADWFLRFDETIQLFCDFAEVPVSPAYRDYFTGTRHFDEAWVDYPNEVYQTLREKLSW